MHVCIASLEGVCSKREAGASYMCAYAWGEGDGHVQGPEGICPLEGRKCRPAWCLRRKGCVCVYGLDGGDLLCK